MEPIDEAMQRASRIVDYLKRDSFFSQPYKAEDLDALIVTDPEQALEYANKLNYDDDSYEEYTDLLEREMAKIKASVPSGLRAQISKRIFGESRSGQIVVGMIDVDRLGSQLTESEEKILDAHFDYQIAACAIYASAGKTSKLFDQILIAFESGGIPCGWMGKYPKGRLIVFLPKSSLANK